MRKRQKGGCEKPWRIEDQVFPSYEEQREIARKAGEHNLLVKAWQDSAQFPDNQNDPQTEFPDDTD
jgi:hypothetical protein